MRIVSVAILLAAAQLSFLGCDSKQEAVSPSTHRDSTVAAVIPTEFNTTDKSIKSNDNVIVAAGKLKNDSPDGLWSKSEKISVNKLHYCPVNS